MSANAKLAASTLVTAAGLLALLWAMVTVAASGLDDTQRALLASIIDQRFGALAMIGLTAMGFIVLALRALVDLLVREPARCNEDALAMLEDPGRRLAPRGAAELQGLIATVNRLAEQRQERESDISAMIAQANARAEEERNRLAALMDELAQGVIVCNLEGRVLLYNRRARAVFSPSSGHGVGALGLGRSIYGVFDRHLIAYALDGIADGRYRQRHFVSVTAAGRLLRVVVAAVPLSAEPPSEASVPGSMSGYLLMVDDMTETFESESARDELLQELTDRSRGAVANLCAAAETLHEYRDMSDTEQTRFLAVIRAEAATLGERIAAASGRFAAMVKARWPLEEMPGPDLVDAAARQIADHCQLRVELEDIETDCPVVVDGFSLLQAFTYLVSRLQQEFAIREVRIRLIRDGGMAHFDLIWTGAFTSNETVMNWELDAMNAAGIQSPLSVRDVIERCGGEVWFQRERVAHRAFFRFLLPVPDNRSRPAAPGGHEGPASRPEFYDFDLFRTDGAADALDERPLMQLSYTVFDTETTGLEPSAGDEIIQIGAVRIVNRRLLRSESFEQLVDPRRPLPESSIRIHGITAEMLAGQPPIDRVLPIFRAFVADTVLVAHNAAFDMRFLEIKEEATGVRFDRPVLDTFLLSAVLFPNQESHRLEAIAERLGVSVLGRHTAVGDALVTAEIFLKMLPLLVDKGIRTLRQARDATEKTYHARTRY